ncbi:hypothetical protein GCM10007111_17220 [Virgibacillus kapii]|uniref:Uncharacterized protein n=1 Tax=Virgibacillus kapii TaxID=1638645 RepID=A0ABQ2DF71_9BACI|nr:hypothetical protein GCM10007111_17220 [Virgibacillus kapii]
MRYFLVYLSCLIEQVSIQQMDEKIAIVEGRENFKDIDTIYREIIETIKGNLLMIQDLNSYSLFNWIITKIRQKGRKKN